MEIVDYKNLDLNWFTAPDASQFQAVVEQLLTEISQKKDQALRELTEKFDQVILKDIRVSSEEIDQSLNQVDADLQKHIQTLITNITLFSEKQLAGFHDFTVELLPGVVTGQRIIPIERVGVYVPGGRFPLISSLLMGAIPAKVAGVSEIAVCSPPSFHGSVHPAILAAAKLAGITEVYRVGGVMAIGGLAYGTETIKAVDKIVGPGNMYVTLAKKAVFGRVGIDFIAGPTEILIIADESADAALVAADLLAQAEHDLQAIPWLVTDSRILADQVSKEVDTQLKTLATQSTAAESWQKNGCIVMVDDLQQAVELANQKAPEHLELHVNHPDQWVKQLRNYGSLFIGELAAEVLGDYSSGLNHVLPTNRASRYTGGLSVKDFIKIQTTLQVKPHGLQHIGPAALAVAKAEGLAGHAASVAKRLAKITE
jgi:histidinol dehydrogenase